MKLTLRFLLLVAACLLPAPLARAASPTPAEKLTFEQHVRPILKAYCLDCHGGEEKLKGKLDLRLRRFIARGGSSGPALVAHQPGKSLLVEVLKSGEMPPFEKKVPPDEIKVIERWIAQGAPTLRAEPETLPPGIDITPEDRAFWFYQPLRRPAPPAVAPADGARTPVDAFVLAKLREKGLTLNPEADRLTLIRRAYLDITGLPPSPGAVSTYLNDRSPNAYEAMVDRLLASPGYGERWGRHWLDVAGYADSDGDGNTDTLRPHAWKYRDYVIRSFDADKPLDRFIVEQLAGDELVPAPWNNLRPEQIELLTATGFLRMAPDSTSSGGGIAEAEQCVTDTVKIVSTTLLGLTVGCAQCHDHRYDPIPQADYFRLRAVFEPALNPANWRRPPARRVSLYTDADRQKAQAVDAEAARMQAAFNVKQQEYVKAAFEKELLKFPADQRDKLRAAFTAPAAKRTPEQNKLVAGNPKLNVTPGVLYQYNQAAADELKKEQDRINAKRAEKPAEDFVAVTSEIPGQVPVTRLHHRGDYRQPKGEVQPGDLTILAGDGKRFEIPAKDPRLPTTGRRLAYARHLTDGKHTLLGRVLVNRIWQHHFGKGIVETAGDFGVLGTRPTHPELLDWLACELAEQGWSLKRLHRLILTSAVYRQSSRRDPRKDAVDAGNALLGRYPLRRLEAEIIRDRILHTAGRLDRTPGGPPVPVTEDMTGLATVPDDRPRRSVYAQVRRTKPDALLNTFDAPGGELNCALRTPSTGAPQALLLMNSQFILAQANVFARRVRAETPAELDRERLAKLIARFPRHTEAWSYGHGEYDGTTRRVAGFAPLPHWTGSSWQGGAVMPDPKLGWVILHAAGGHAGNDQRHAAVRRWTAPADGTLSITGKLQHASPNGDGVRGRIVSSRSGPAGEYTVKAREQATAATLAVKAGDTVDFVVDCNGDVTSDSFAWPVTLSLAPANGETLTWDSAADFRGPSAASLAQMADYAWRLAYQRPATLAEADLACAFLGRQIRQLRAAKNADPELSALTNLCQQLLASNEFLYVD